MVDGEDSRSPPVPYFTSFHTALFTALSFSMDPDVLFPLFRVPPLLQSLAVVECTDIFRAGELF